ncbi:Hypothetical protein R9X50_00205600 [Acrodontium crateriforme]|uniref:CRAL-TRIO domain-containing protein n=1 Tax=Acrodontium crateriforme TaxID=150365 RepID=A0AAQ3M3I7_9PEZI|nr:Hypothetical protein R9X50_00205600 [Acrodontium crateriforme]
MADVANVPAVQNGPLNEKAPLENVVPTAGSTPKVPSRSESVVSFKSTAEDVQLATTNGPAGSSNQAEAGAEKKQEEGAWQPPVGVWQKIITKPTQDSRPPPQPVLSAEQEAKYTAVFTDVSSWETIPATTAKNAPQSAIQDYERMWLTRECILRYLRATKWKTADALKRLESTMSWRREYGADTFTADYISPENETGKQLVLGYDRETRPILYLNPGNQNTKMSDRQIHHLCFMLDRTIDMMPPGQESACLLINFKSSSNSTLPSVAQSRAVLNILQNHSPERLGKALITETPWYVTTFFKLISGFIDPVTKEKMKFNEDLTQYVPVEQLWADRGGDLKFTYDHSLYWPSLNDECNKRRAAYKKRWEDGGKRIGEFEAYLRGGNHESLQQVLEKSGIDTSASKHSLEVTAQVARLSLDNRRE